MNITTQMAAGVSELITSNASEIEQCLAESKDGSLTVSISCKLKITAGATSAKLKLSYAQKHTDEDELIAANEDPNQPELIGGSE